MRYPTRKILAYCAGSNGRTDAGQAHGDMSLMLLFRDGHVRFISVYKLVEYQPGGSGTPDGTPGGAAGYDVL